MYINQNEFVADNNEPINHVDQRENFQILAQAKKD